MKALLIILICLLFVYSPVELTRVIIDWGLSGKFIFEIAFMWVFYLAGLFIVFRVILKEGGVKV